MPTALITHSSYAGHQPPEGHPERPARIAAVHKALSADRFQTLDRRTARAAADTELTLAHPERYVRAVTEFAPGEGLVMLDGDTAMSPGSLDAARHAAGAILDAVDGVMTGQFGNAFCAVRPPGHHAEPAKPMGFCLFNSVAIAARYARQHYGAERVAVIDFDVHHGNGTQASFWEEPDLFYGSTHQMPLFPGTGAAAETGANGRNIVNAPLRPGAGGPAFREAMEDRVLPALQAFRPDLLIVSAGFDAHVADPLANLTLGVTDFDWITRRLLDIAGDCCGGRVVSALEGGYDLSALAESVTAHVAALMEGAE